METRAGDPGAFAQFDLNRVDSPAFVVDAAKLRANCQVLADIRDAADIKMLSALKAFSMFSAAPIVGEYLDGVCTSGLYEARLASEFYDGEISTYCAAYKPEDLDEVIRLSDHVIFNSPQQIVRASAILEQAKLTGGDFNANHRQLSREQEMRDEAGLVGAPAIDPNAAQDDAIRPNQVDAE